jgi:hypothetical protein
MTVFYVDVGENNRKLREGFKDRNVHFSDPDRCIQVFVRFLYELKEDLFLEKKNGQHKGYQQDANGQKNVKKYLSGFFQG